MVICLERGADLHMAQLMPLPLTVSCFSKIQIGITFLIPAHLGSPGKRAVKRVCVSSSVSGTFLQIAVVLLSSRIFPCPVNLVCVYWESQETTSVGKLAKRILSNFLKL